MLMKMKMKNYFDLQHFSEVADEGVGVVGVVAIAVVVGVVVV
jgi:hypothetical protein